MYFLRTLTATTCEICATYDEGAVATAEPGSPFSWFHPYGEPPLEYSEDDIHARIGQVDIQGEPYDKVLLSPGWHIDHKHSPLPPANKETIKCGGLPPYGTRETYWDTARKFPDTTPLGRAIDVLKAHRAVHPRLRRAEHLYRQIESEQHGDSIERSYYALRDQLAPLLNPSEGNNKIMSALEAALPPQLPPPAPSMMNYPPLHGDARWARITWQWRLMYALCLGIALEQL